MLVFGSDDVVFSPKIGVKLLDMIFKFELSRSGPPQSLFKVVNFLLEFDDLVLFLVQQDGIIHHSVASLLVLH